jgi:hypothetical protein
VPPPSPASGGGGSGGATAATSGGGHGRMTVDEVVEALQVRGWGEGGFGHCVVDSKG